MTYLKRLVLKATAVAPSNIAFIKYWGKKDEELRLPTNGSISVNLNNLLTTTTVEFDSKLNKDLILINDRVDEKNTSRVIEHLDRVRKIAKINFRARVNSKNNFPSSVGLASSAAGFAALTLAATKAAGLSLTEVELSILARLGSGSACRSIPNGFVEWIAGDSNETSYGKSLFPPDYWNLSIIAVIVGTVEKKISSTSGHSSVKGSLFLQARLKNINEKIVQIKKYLKEKNFLMFGALIEREALELHALTFTSDPPILYWEPDTLRLMKLIQKWRKKGLNVFFTIDAGPNLFLLMEEKNESELVEKLRTSGFKNLIVNKPSVGARVIDSHLF